MPQKSEVVEKYMPKTAVLQLFHNQNPKCAIFSKENMILIKDRHQLSMYPDSSTPLLENMILIKDRHAG